MQKFQPNPIMIGGFSLTPLILLVSMQVHAVLPTSANLARQLKNTPCSASLRLQIDESLARQGWMPTPISEMGKPFTYGIRFRDFKNQLAYKIWSDPQGANYLISDLKTKKEILNHYKLGTCEPTVVTRDFVFPPLPIEKGFDDKSLAEVVKSHDWGIIYVWTPYMPLSVEGLKDIKTAVREKNGYLTILMDAKASSADAKKWETLGKVRAEEELPVASNELYARDISLHYPIAFLYENGQLSNRTYVGHKSDVAYKKWFEVEKAQLTAETK